MNDDVDELKVELCFNEAKDKTIHQELNDILPYIPEFAKLDKKDKDNVNGAYFQCEFLFNMI
jgi:hypothetical protein